MPWIELPYETDPPDRLYAPRDEGLPSALCHRDGDEVTVRVHGEPVEATWDAEVQGYRDEDGDVIDGDRVEAVWDEPETRGRPPVAGVARTVRVELRLTPAERDTLQRLADRAELSASEWIREAIETARKRAR